MQTGDKKLFLDPSQLYEMLELRFLGHSAYSLAILFNCDYTSIYYQCDKYKVLPQNKLYNIKKAINSVMQTVTQYKIVNEEKINLGKNYKEYMAEAKERGTPESRYPSEFKYPLI